MDIQIFEKNTLKIKIKKADIAVNPKSSVQKFDADAVLVNESGSDVSRINNFRVIIDGAGDFEVSGLKIHGLKSKEGLIYELNSDNILTLVANASSLENISSQTLDECQVVIINVNNGLNTSLITAMEPRVVVLYGEKAKEAAKAFGKDNIPSSSKISFSEEKLPEEMEVKLLG